MKLDPQAITEAAQKAYAAREEYTKVEGAAQVYMKNTPYPELPSEAPPTPEQYNEWVDAKIAYSKLVEALKAPAKEAKSSYYAASEELNKLLPDNVYRMRVTLEEGTFDLSISYDGQGAKAIFVRVHIGEEENV